MRQESITLIKEPTYEDYYRQDQDPLWDPLPPAPRIDSLAWYQCDHLGTPKELTDAQQQIAWSAEYKAWGMAKEAIRQASEGQLTLRTPLRFQGQYYDHETGLHYNRHRYYDPEVGRFINKDPISYAGGLNLFQYAPNTTEWVDPLGLTKIRCIPLVRKKRGPKTDGQGPHNEKIVAWHDEVRANGGEVIAGGRGKEKLVKTPGGHKTGRRADIMYKDKDGNLIYGNVGRTKADGTPVTREVKAIQDLKTKTLDKDIPHDVIFRSYDR